MSDAGFADGFADGDGDVRVRPVAPRRAATAGAAAAAGRAAPRSRAAELAFTNVKAYFTTCLFVDGGERSDGSKGSVNGQLKWGQ